MGELYASCPLDRTRREIRLLTLQPNNDEDMTRCSLQTYSPEDCPSYTALSYTWGADVMHTDIEINGVSVPIRENLWDFLHQQLLHENYGPFWIEAVCIQQSEVDERNHQVQMMGSIYSNARKVLVWLGKEGEDSDLAIRALTTWTWSRRYSGRALPNLFPNEDKDSKKATKENESATIWTREEARSVLSLCGRAYWSRMWIIQEVLLALDKEVHCGTLRLKWYKLVQLYDYLDKVKFSTNQEAFTPFHNVLMKSGAMRIANNTSMTRGPSNKLSFNLLFQMYGDHECAEIRDKVYALVGVGRYGSVLELDYRRPVKDILLDVFYLEIIRWSWERQGGGHDSKYDTGYLLERVLGVPFPEDEVSFHLNCSSDIAREVYHRLYDQPQLDFSDAFARARQSMYYTAKSHPSK
ncbi:heterokaryon incompatibility protein-domain-containing protein [Alternaria rosae]|uniref:heterokaryon incompatibility protein-domain-containing protein n=1 Tax=Alternaria rosae TaxID=1187941 RepID=UPI001E8CBC0C|nr:heterokaryon incompatibility protein-domain-containing protein [Alternaria rosae]KAH6879109.1 heterokaryon incompatibility protein-domain-containing protein [Alternaria rosae]